MVQVTLHGGDFDKALRTLKKKMQREGIFREMKMRRYYEKESEAKVRKRKESERRRRKLERKRYLSES